MFLVLLQLVEKKKRKIAVGRNARYLFLSSSVPFPFSFFLLSSSFPFFLPPFSRHLPPLHVQLTNMSSQRAPVSKTSAKPPAKKSKPVSKAKKSKEIIDEEVDEAED